MKLSEIKDYIKSLAEQDLSITDADMNRWIDSAIDKINITLQCNIPKTAGKAADYVPEFDDRFHDAILLFANARYRESDADFNSANYFVNQFNDMLKVMQRDMTVKPSQRADMNVQQIVVTDISKLDYKLTMKYGSYFDTIVVYANDVEVEPIYYRINLSSKSIIFKNPLAVNDKITVVFENNSDLNEPPYQWWTF